MQLPKERPDDLDRVKSPAASKLQTLCEWSRAQLGRDPRGGGISFVGRPRVIEQIWNELPEIMRKLGPVVVVGTHDADVVFTWEGVAIRVRSNVKDDKLYALEDTALPGSQQQDRRLAGEMRFRAARGMALLPPQQELIS